MTKIKMDQETREKLYGLMPATSEFTVNYTPGPYKDLPSEFQPIFTLKPWTHKRAKEIALHTEENKDDEEYLLESLRANIIGWSKMIDASNGNPLEFKGDPGLDRVLFDILPQKIKLDILNKLLKISGLA